MPCKVCECVLPKLTFASVRKVAGPCSCKAAQVVFPNCWQGESREMLPQNGAYLMAVKVLIIPNWWPLCTLSLSLTTNTTTCHDRHDINVSGGTIPQGASLCSFCSHLGVICSTPSIESHRVHPRSNWIEKESVKLCVPSAVFDRKTCWLAAVPCHSTGGTDGKPIRIIIVPKWLEREFVAEISNIMAVACDSVQIKALALSFCVFVSFTPLPTINGTALCVCVCMIGRRSACKI